MTDIETVIANHLTHDEASFAVGYLEQAAKNTVSELNYLTQTMETSGATIAIQRIAGELLSAINNVRQRAREACKP